MENFLKAMVIMAGAVMIIASMFIKETNDKINIAVLGLTMLICVIGKNTEKIK